MLPFSIVEASFDAPKTPWIASLSNVVVDFDGSVTDQVALEFAYHGFGVLAGVEVGEAV